MATHDLSMPFEGCVALEGSEKGSVPLPCRDGYSLWMVEIRQTERFAQWCGDYRDSMTRAKVQARIMRMISSNHFLVAEAMSHHQD